MRICSVASTSPRCAAATSGTQPTAAISGRASGTRAKRRERLRADRRRGVVGRADALQGEDGRSGALLERRRGAAGALARLVADVVLLGAPERQREGRGRESADEECEGESEACRHAGRVFGLAGEGLERNQYGFGTETQSTRSGFVSEALRHVCGFESG